MSNQKKIFDWLGISNIVVSLIVGVGVALYLANRNENLQSNIVQLQAKLQGEYNSAHLEISCPHIDCTQMLVVTNTGFGVAKSVNLVIAISSVSLPWTPFVDTIDKFRLSIRPSSIPVQIKPIIDTSVNLLPSKKNNAYMLTIENLGPRTSFTVAINADNLYKSTSITKYKSQYNAILYYSAAESQALNDANNIKEIINDFIDSNFFVIANFTMEASCASCAGDTTYASYPLFKPSTNNNNFLVSSNSETFLPIGTPQPLQGGGYDLAVSYTIVYMLPKGSKQISIPSPLYLQVNNFGSDNQSILECQAADCSKFPSS